MAGNLLIEINSVCEDWQYASRELRYSMMPEKEIPKNMKEDFVEKYLAGIENICPYCTKAMVLSQDVKNYVLIDIEQYEISFDIWKLNTIFNAQWLTMLREL